MTFRNAHTRLLPGSITAIAVVLAATLSHAQSQSAPRAAGADAALAGAAAHAVLQRALAPSLYEVVYSASTHSLFVASAGGRGSPGGTVFRLDPQTLEVKQKIELPLKPFALAVDERSNTLYAGHTRDGAVSAIDASTGKLKGTLRHGVLDAAGKPVHVRQLLVDAQAGKLYVTGVTDGGFLWVIDGRHFRSERTLAQPDAPTVGIALDEGRQRLFVSGTAAYAAFDTQSWKRVETQRIPEKLQPTDPKRRFLVNIALTSDGSRLFANQLNNGEGTLVFDVASGRTLATIATGETPVGVRFNAVRNEVYVATLGSGTVSIVDADTYAIKHRLSIPRANSLAIAPDGQALFVTAKKASGEASREQVVRIDLGSL